MGKSDQGVTSSAGRYTVIPRVLVFVFNGGDSAHPRDVLLLKGAPTKRIWADRYNGVGGHIEADEDVYTAARREIREEAGLDVQDLRLRGIVNIDAGQEAGIMLFVFRAYSEDRRTRPSEEGTLEWIPLDRIHEYDLVEDLPALLGRTADRSECTPLFFARYSYDADDRLCITFADRDG